MARPGFARPPSVKHHQPSQPVDRTVRIASANSGTRQQPTPGSSLSERFKFIQEQRKAQPQSTTTATEQKQQSKVKQANQKSRKAPQAKTVLARLGPLPSQPRLGVQKRLSFPEGKTLAAKKSTVVTAAKSQKKQFNATGISSRAKTSPKLQQQIKKAAKVAVGAKSKTHSTTVEVKSKSNNVSSRAGRGSGNNTRGVRGRGGIKAGTKRTPLSKDALDRSLDSYMMKNEKTAVSRLDQDLDEYMAGKDQDVEMAE